MHQNIKNKHSRRLDAKLFNQKYYDFMLYKGEVACDCASCLNDMVIADFSDLFVEDGKLYSTKTWSGSTNNGVIMNDIGMTGIDNGFICFDNKQTTEDKFLDIFFNTTYTIPSGDTRMFLSPIRSNTQLYSYDSEIIKSGDTKYLALKGGFYQGFFKLFGYDYQLLPDKFSNDIVLHFDLKPRTDYEISENSVNKTHSGNTGIFFFMGTRAENKFFGYYLDGLATEEKDNYFADDFVDDDFINVNCSDEKTDKYFADDFINDDLINVECKNPYSAFTDSNKHKLFKKDYYKIYTDNKFMFFDRTDTGFTVDNWIDGAKVVFDGLKKKNINYFPWLNRTKTGFTIDNIDVLQEYFDYIDGKSEEEIEKGGMNKLFKDVRNNVFALRVTPDGAIGYKYGLLDCDVENHYSVIEEYSLSGIVESDKWNSVNVRFAILNPTENKCDTRPRKMKIMIYVNGFLKFISKELDALSFKELDDVYEKQESVPYNISLGGGSIGLLESLFPYNLKIKKTLPIEKDFCGTFIGDIKSFKIYMGFIDYCAIKNYLS